MSAGTLVRTSRIEDLPQLYDGLFKQVGKGLGIRGFGINVVDLPPDYTTRAHDESDTGQEELYMGLEGDGAVIVHSGDGDVRHPLGPGELVLVQPGTSRTLTCGPAGSRMVVVGGVPDGVYKPRG